MTEELCVLEPDEIEQILKQYDLGEFEQVSPLTAGTVQTNLLLCTSTGKWVLRYYSGNRGYNSVVFEANLVHYLASKGYPCPQIIADRYGKRVGRFRARPYALFEFVEGVHLEHPTEAQRQQLIRHVAELQNLTRNYRSAYQSYRWNYGVDLCADSAEDAARRNGSADAAAKLRWYQRQLAKLVLPRTLPKGICHADFHYSNVLFQDGKFRALIDFDDANYTYLTFDLACLIEPELLPFDWDSWHGQPASGTIFEFDEARKIVAEYQRVRLLNALERKYLFDVVKLAILIDCIWFFDRGHADAFYERRKIECLDLLGRDEFATRIFG